MSDYLLRLYTALLLSVVYVTAEKGGYSALVSFAQNVAFEDGKALMDNVQESVQKASEVLHGATGLKFSKVTFQIPYSWDTSEWNISVVNSYKHDKEKADILIDSTDDVVFGKFPFTRQYGSCGTPGHQIIIPAAFFQEANLFPKGISLAREWLKYHYGVFDENGYLEDPLYPLSYTIPGRDKSEVKITDCTNVELAYSFVDSNGNCSTDDKTLTERLNNGECKIQVDEDSLSNVTSSFMYYEELFSNMQHICGRNPDHKHNSRSPNKQNALCYGKSIWEIVQNSSNFQTVEANDDPTDIQYVYVQEPKPKVVVAWEDTDKLGHRRDAILHAVNKFMIDLPYGSMFSAFPFIESDLSSTDISMNELKDLTDKKLVPTIKSDFQEPVDGNVNIAISKAIDILRSNGIKDSELAADIIIITGSQGDSSDANIIEKIKGMDKVCIKILFLGDGELSDEVKEYSEFPCATVNRFNISDTNEVLFEKLYESMEHVLPLTTDDKATETVKAEYLTQNSFITFEADDFTESVTFWIFDIKSVKYFNLTLNGKEEKVEKAVEIGNVMSISYSVAQAGTIGLTYRYKVDPAAFVQVTTTSKKSKYFSGEVLVHNPSQGYENQMPVIIYAIVRFGPYPLQKAKVSATIEDPTKAKTELDLYDDGKGDPDITENDGIYSRYFTAFTGPGVYTVTVHVSNNENLLTYGKDEKSGYQTCCGSTVKEGNSTEFAGFSRTFHGTFTAVSGRPEEGYKPSRITDLRIDEVTDDKIILKWSAPGGEADTGAVKSYEIKYFNSQEDAMNNFDGSNELNYTETPKERGNIESFEISFKEFEKSGQYYIVVKGKNENKISDLSNTVAVFISEDKITDEKDGKDEDTKDKDVKTGGPNKKTITIVIGVIVAVVVLAIIIYLLIYFAIVKPKLKSEKKKKENQPNRSGPKVENSSLSPVNFIAADTLIRHHNEKTKAKMENKEPPILKEEDFENKSQSPANETEAENDDQQPEISNKISSNGLPPKSPKRTTYV